MANYIKAADDKYYFDNYGSEEELTENNFYHQARALPSFKTCSPKTRARPTCLKDCFCESSTCLRLT